MTVKTRTSQEYKYIQRSKSYLHGDPENKRRSFFLNRWQPSTNLDLVAGAQSDVPHPFSPSPPRPAGRKEA
jgi:hypothetical protein